MNPRNKANHRRALPRNITLVGNHPAQPENMTKRLRDLPRHINRETNQSALERLIRTVRLVHPSDLENRSHKKILIKPRRQTSVWSNPRKTNSKNQIGTTKTTHPRTWRTSSRPITNQMLNLISSNLRVPAPVRLHLRPKILLARKRQIFNLINNMDMDMDLLQQS